MYWKIYMYQDYENTTVGASKPGVGTANSFVSGTSILYNCDGKVVDDGNGGKALFNASADGTHRYFNVGEASSGCLLNNGYLNKDFVLSFDV